MDEEERKQQIAEKEQLLYELSSELYKLRSKKDLTQLIGKYVRFNGAATKGIGLLECIEESHREDRIKVRFSEWYSTTSYRGEISFEFGKCVVRTISTKDTDWFGEVSKDEYDLLKNNIISEHLAEFSDVRNFNR